MILISDTKWKKVNSNPEIYMRIINTWFVKHDLRINYIKSIFIVFLTKLKFTI